MGRGLSPEQRRILISAAGASPPGTPSGVDLLIRDAIEACYPSLRYLRDAQGKPPSAGSNYWPEQTPELKRAKASVSRAIRRLEQRGLVERLMGAVSRWGGLKLTDEGRLIAEKLRPEMHKRYSSSGDQA
jgi:hypothetical protein